MSTIVTDCMQQKLTLVIINLTTKKQFLEGYQGLTELSLKDARNKSSRSMIVGPKQHLLTSRFKFYVRKKL